MKRYANVQIALLVIVAAFSSCADSNPQYKDGDTIFFPDTAAFIKSWNVEEQVMLDDLFARDSFYNQLGLDTLELTSSMCDCPDWIDKTKGDIDCKECTDFYIEAADPSLLLPDALEYGTTVRFYGVILPGRNLPQGREFYSSNPPAWTVLRYYGFEILRPYKIWGPKWRMFQGPGDTIEQTAELIIR